MFIFLLLFILSSPNLLSKDKDNGVVEGEAEDISIGLGDNKVEIKEGAKAKYGNVTVEAGSINHNEEKNLVVADGKIVYSYGSNYKIVGDSLELDLEKKIATLKKGRTVLNKFHMTGEEIVAEFPRILSVKNGTITTCCNEHPHFHIAAGRVNFYPDSKFYGYSGWLYIKDWPIFPIPFYASYVVEKEDRAPLLPKIDWDEEKGYMLIWGIDHQLLRNYRIGPIKDINLFSLLNAELSTKRKLGINKMILSYEAMDAFSGNFTVKDLVGKGGDLRDIRNLSYRITAENSLRTKDGVFFKLGDGSYIIGKSDFNFRYGRTDSELSRDYDGNYINDEGGRKTFSQIDLNLDQEIWKYFKINTNYRMMDIRPEVLNDLLERDKEMAERAGVDDEKYRMDTEILKGFSLKGERAGVGKLLIEHLNNFNERPERENAINDYKEHSQQKVTITWNRYVNFTFDYENSSKDRWERKKSYRQNYIAGEKKLDLLSLKIGEHYIPKTSLRNTITIEQRKEEDFEYLDLGLLYFNNQERHEEFNLSFAQAHRIANQEFDSRHQNEKDKKEEKYRALKFALEHDGIRIKSFDKFTLIPNYMFDVRKYINAQNSSEKLFDIYLNTFGIKIPMKLFNNLDNNDRTADIKSAGVLFGERVFVRGNKPMGIESPNEKRKLGANLELEFGNVGATYQFSNDREYESFADFKIREDVKNHLLRVVIDKKEFLILQYEDKGEWKIDNPSTKKIFKGGVDFGSIALNYSKGIIREVDVRKRENQYERIGSTDIDIDEYSIKLFGVNGSYSVENVTRNNLVGLSLGSTLRKKYSLSHNKKWSDEIESTFKLSYSDALNKGADMNGNPSLSIFFNLKDFTDVYRLRKKEKEIVEKLGREGEEILDDKKNQSLNEETLAQEEKRVEEALAKREKMSQRSLMDLGEDIKKEKQDEYLRELSFKLKIDNSDEEAYRNDFSWESYKNSWQYFDFQLRAKYSNKFQFEYSLEKERRDFSLVNKMQKLSLLGGIGSEGYEWILGPSLHYDYNKKRYKTMFEVKHNMHCTRLEVSFGKVFTVDKEDKIDFKYALGFSFEILDFPSKKLSINSEGKELSAGEMGI